jgi:hypothetical protein
MIAPLLEVAEVIRSFGRAYLDAYPANDGHERSRGHVVNIAAWSDRNGSVRFEPLEKIEGPSAVRSTGPC